MLFRSWFTQIYAVAATLGKLFNVNAESATACAATLLLVTFLGIIPLGLIWARVEHVSLKKISEESEQAGVGELTEPIADQAAL